MAELVAGAFLSSFLQVAFERLASHDFRDYFCRRKMDDGLLKKLHAVLLSVDKIVEDAEERQYRDHRVKQWLDELKDEVFKAQDLLDDIATEALRQKLHAESQTAGGGKVRGLFNALVNRNQSEKKIESGIKEVINNLENLIKQNKILGLRVAPSASIESGVHMNVYKRLPTTRLIDESDMYGRDADKERIVELLLSQSMGGNQLPIDVIAITGMGGMGKTTLAKLVYEDVKVKHQFEHRAWVCVSEEFNVHQVTKAILQQSLNYPIEKLQSHDRHSYQLKLKETLIGKKFFLVLDDVWNENFKIWEVFQAPLKHAAPQSKILVTTRNQKVAEVMCCTFTHSLKPLEDGDCWNLFAKHAFNNNQQHPIDPDLIQIGRKIVDRCGGLPLAIKTLGSLLHRKLSFRYWDKILQSDLWELSETDSHIIPSLRLSYHYLPSNLKRCFAYCSIFPKDYDIDKNVLIQLWMADGLICPTQKSMSLEEAGNEIFNDLESRSFFEPSRKGDDYFIMHDLVNDLAKSLTQEFFVQLEVDHAQAMSTKTRYFSYIDKNCENLKIPKEVFKCHRLHTFLLSNYSDRGFDIMSRLSQLKYIQELSLRGNGSKNLTKGISNLKHLHYLDLSWTEVKKLPNSMCLLINLQTLKLRGCPLSKLPSNFYKLINLRHLDLERCGIKKMPKYMGKLNQLRTMNEFAVAKKEGSNIKELGALKHLTGSLAISNMECIKDVADMREANLKAKKLHTLKLRYWRRSYSRNEAQHQEQVLEAVDPNHNVKDLTVEGYRGNKFPKWLASAPQLLPNLVSLCLSYCSNIVNLPPLGQLPSLQKLVLSELDGIKVIGEELYGNGSSIAPFPCLSYLSISKFWHDLWLPIDRPLIAFVPNPSLVNEGEMVKDHMLANGSWDISRWQGILHPSIINTISRTHPPSNSLPDCFTWRAAKDGCFSVKSAYLYLSDRGGANVNNFWTLIWKWQLPEKVKFFMWQVGHERLVTNSLRARRGLTNGNLCPFPCNSEETVLHIIRDCDRAKQLWKQILQSNYFSQFFAGNLQVWLNWNTNHNPGKGRFRDFSWPRVFSLGCWILWTTRCKFLFQGENTDTREMLHLCNYLLMENTVNQSLTHQIFQLDRFEEKTWTPPPTDAVRLDVDGSVRHQHQAACGGVIRDSQGHWLMGFHKFLGTRSVIEAELHAIMIGLTMSRQMGLHRVILYSDSHDAINIIMRDYYTDHPLRDVIGEIRDLLFQDWNVEIRHTPRENISCADYMAKQGHDATDAVDVVQIPTIPRGCLHMVLKDQLACNC